MKTTQKLFYIFLAGGLGGFTNSLVVWSLAKLGITPALGFTMIPGGGPEWWMRRIAASALWGIIFLIPICQKKPVTKGAILSVLPWLSSVLFVFPVQMKMGFFGMGFGVATPLWTLFFAMVWGVTGTLFLAKWYPGNSNLKSTPQRLI